MRLDRMLLEDALEAVDEIIECAPVSRDAFDADKFRRSHLLRQIQIIGEVACRLSDPVKQRHPDVPWRKIAGMRHVLVHDYFDVDWNAVYNVVVRDIPALKPRLQAILTTLPSENP